MVEIIHLVEILGRSGDLEQGVRLALPETGRFLCAVAGRADLKKRTKNATDFSTIAQWSNDVAIQPPGETLSLLGEFYNDLCPNDVDPCHPVIKEISTDIPGIRPQKRLFLPVSYGGRVLAFLGFFCSLDEVDHRLMEKAQCVMSILSLWLKGCHLEKQLKDLIDFIPNPLMMLDGDERVTVWNPAMESMSGVPCSKMIGKGNYEHAKPFYNERRPTSSNLILHPDSDWEERYLELKTDRDTMFALARSEALPGGPMLIASKTRRIYDLTGAPDGSVHIIQDVTHERELESSLNRTEAMYQGVSDFVGVGIALLGGDTVYSCNENFLALLELNEQDLSIDSIFNRMEKGAQGKLKLLFQGIFLSDPQPASIEFIAFTPIKGRREYKGYAQAVTYETKPAVHFIIIDITESRELERRKQLHQVRMFHSDRLTALGTLSAGIAHELNQPLNTIRVIADGILYGRENGWLLNETEVYDNAEMISRQSLRMSSVIQNIRRFARDDRDRNFENVNINQAIRNVFSMIGQQLIAHGIQVEEHLEPDLPVIRTHLNHLEQVVMNLVVNARQALDGSSKKGKRLWVRTGYRFGQIFLEVGDNATGISALHKKEIFDPFFTTKAVGKGTGLGLSISQTIVASFGGVIDAYNNNEQGATFFVTVPGGAL